MSYKQNKTIVDRLSKKIDNLEDDLECLKNQLKDAVEDLIDSCDHPVDEIIQFIDYVEWRVVNHFIPRIG